VRIEKRFQKECLMQFCDLRLIEPILRALVSEGYSTATPIQAKAIPPALQGRDVLGSAQTGTGKTAAFALPIIQQLSLKHGTAAQKSRLRCLVLCPTRELASQIGDGFRAYGKNLSLRHTVIFGGVGQNPQVDALRRGTDILIATPGRLLDLMDQGCCDLRNIEVLVLDEADRMLDMGFIRDIRKIVQQLPANRQTMLFSATMPAEIRQLANAMLRNPAVVQVAPVATPIEMIEQSVYFVEKRNKPQLLAHLVNELPMSRAIVFTRTKHGADKVVRHLHTRGIKAEAIHGNKSQNNRQRALANFKSNKIPVLVATDIASRGIDIDDVSHVVNYDLTHEPETYVHRIGRTARAGASGAAIAFCDHEERENLRAIEKLIRQSIPVREDHPTYTAAPAKAAASPGSDDSHGASRQAPRQTNGHPHSSSHSNSGSHPHSNGRPQSNSHSRSQPNSNSHRSSSSHPASSNSASRRQASSGHAHQPAGSHGHPQRGGSSRSAPRSAGAGRGAPRSQFKGKPKHRRAF
jgi:ATP-dependent RNA helicase RhlE